MDKTIAITGTTGFVGGAMVRYFLARGWRVLAFGRRSVLSCNGNMRYIQWDISRSVITVDETVQAVVHAAAYVNDWGKYEDFYAANVIGTQNVLNSFPEAAHFVHISSSSVYNPITPKHNIDESYPYAERYLNDYGTTKMLAEQVVMQSQKPNLVILRPHAVYGQGDTTILPKLLKSWRGHYMFGVGDGQNRTHLTYIGNLCYAVELAIQAECDCEVFNIADAEPLTLDMILNKIVERLELNARIVYIPFALAIVIAQFSDWLYEIFKLQGQPLLTRYRLYNFASEYTVNISKARKTLGYNPPYDFDTGLLAVKHWLEEENGWQIVRNITSS